MSPRAKMEYLETIYLRYKKASVKEKTLILHGFCLNFGYEKMGTLVLMQLHISPTFSDVTLIENRYFSKPKGLRLKNDCWRGDLVRLIIIPFLSAMISDLMAWSIESGSLFLSE